MERTEGALRTADADADGAVSAAERSTLPEDVRGLADATADAYLGGGAMDVGQYLAAYSDFASSALRDADTNGDGKLQNAEQSRLPAEIYKSVLALRTAPTTPTTPTTTGTPTTPTTPSTGAALGIAGTKSPSDITIRTVVSQGLSAPTGIGIDPRTGKLWIVNRDGDSSMIVDNPSASRPTTHSLVDTSAHFMNNPMGIAFSPVFEEMATVQDTTNDYNMGGMGNMFMGPTLWPTDDTFTGDDASHLDMLHHSPSSVGIAAGTAYPLQREYWVFNGTAGSIDRYFFGQPHVHGGTDHSDGITIRYAAGALAAQDRVPGQLALDSASGTLFIADTANRRIARLDTAIDVSNATKISGFHDETPLYRAPGASIVGVTDASAGLVAPSGLVLVDGQLVVSDFATGHIKVFTKDGGLVGDLDTGLGAEALGGLAVDKDGRLFVADMKNHRVFEIRVR